MHNERPVGMDDPHGLWKPQAAQMHIGTQRFTNSDEDLGFLNRQGVANMAINQMPVHREIGWDVEWQRLAEKAKCALPVQTLNAGRSRIPAFMRGDFKQGGAGNETVCKISRTESVPLGNVVALPVQTKLGAHYVLFGRVAYSRGGKGAALYAPPGDFKHFIAGLNLCLGCMAESD